MERYILIYKEYGNIQVSVLPTLLSVQQEIDKGYIGNDVCEVKLFKSSQFEEIKLEVKEIKKVRKEEYVINKIVISELTPKEKRIKN